jgi:phage shock protein A
MYRIKYKLLSILEALGLYKFEVVGTNRITEALSALTETVEQLHYGEIEVEEEIEETQEEINELKAQLTALDNTRVKAETVRKNLLALMGE